MNNQYSNDLDTVELHIDNKNEIEIDGIELNSEIILTQESHNPVGERQDPNYMKYLNNNHGNKNSNPYHNPGNPYIPYSVQQENSVLNASISSNPKLGNGPQSDIYQSHYYGQPNHYSNQNNQNMVNPNYQSYMYYGNSNINNTQMFMKKVDISCDDHTKKYNESVQATRYCSDCKVLCCDSCVIDFHQEHIQNAKLKVDDYIRIQKNDLVSLKDANRLNIEHRKFLTEIEDCKATKIKQIEKFFSKRITQYEALRSSIADLIKEEEDAKVKFQMAIEVFYKEECYNRIEGPIKTLGDSKFNTLNTLF